MQNILHNKDLLSLSDLSSQELDLILHTAAKLKSDWKKGVRARPLLNKAVAVILLKPSLRTRLSFEVGIERLGGQCVMMTGSDSAFSRDESILDTAKVLEGYVDAIVIRAFEDSMVEELAEHASIPVVNGLTDGEHPCQGLTDLLTIMEEFGELKGRKIAYIGDGANNMAHTYLYAAALSGMHIAIAAPAGYQPDNNVFVKALNIAAETDSLIEILSDSMAAAKDADVIITDTFVSMGQEEGREEKLAVFKDYQVQQKHLNVAKGGAIFMHCLPAHRGEEVSEEVIDGPQSRIYNQAENRLYAQQAVLALLMNERI